MVSEREAKKILLELRKRNKERQKEWKAKMEAQGYKRISVMISGEAHQMLDDEAKRLDLPKGSILNDVIINYFTNNRDNISGNIKQNIKTKIKNREIDRQTILRRIADLKAEGLSNRAIVAQLEAEGFPTVSGRGKWSAGSVGKFIREIKEAR